MNRVYIVPQGTEVPEILGLTTVTEENKFAKLVKASETGDGTTYLEATDADLDFLTRHRLDIPFTPLLLTGIPSVKYPRHFLLSQTVFDTVSYDILEAEKVGERRNAEDEERAMNEKLQTMSKSSRSTFKPPKASSTSRTSDQEEFIVEED